MNERDLQRKLNQPYSQANWKEFVEFVFPNVSILAHPTLIPIQNDKVESFYQIGNVKLNDGKTLALFELKLKENVNIIRNRVELNEIVSRYIDQEQYHGVLSIFEQGKQDFRFTFSAKASEFDEEAGDFMHRKTDTKRFTYVLGKNESCRTPAERFYQLSKLKAIADINTVEDAFSVEKLSKQFFEDYVKQYSRFVDYLKQTTRYYNIIFNEDDKKVREFVKIFLGRLVFIKFVQKKGWMGVPLEQTNWSNGQYDFLERAFEKFDNKDVFYSDFLYQLFNEALNSPNRLNDVFKLTGTKVPFLGGGLFDNEDFNSKDINFPKSYFDGLFEFLKTYNFTIDENDLSFDREVGIDPEMLGHIFENLLEDNKDRGVFYTPKEIVRYMCQQSLKEYLKNYLQQHRHWPTDANESKELEDDLNKFITNKDAGGIIMLEEPIANALKIVKICDPAIGSGAFPMGLLNEIFLSVRTLYGPGNDITKRIWNLDFWEPEKVKQSIIQNSIYGVDLDEGAVNIARLRFWLSLIVDEDRPQPLPNLDYKIMQGNSVVESYKGIDLSNVSKSKSLKITELDKDLFGNLTIDQLNITFDKVGIAESIQDKTHKYFSASVDIKPKLKKEINELVLDFIEYNIELRQNQIERFINQIETENIDESKRTKTQNRKYDEWISIRETLLDNKAELKDLQNKEEKPFFLWHLFFADAFKDGGFDIIIGNPPYIKEYTNKSAFDEFRNTKYYQGKMDLWYGFACKGLDWLKEGGIECFIAQSNWITSSGASILRNEILSRSEIKTFIDFGDYKVFQSAGIQTMIYLLQKSTKPSSEYELFYGALNDFNITKTQLSEFLDNKKLDSEYFDKYTQLFKPEKFYNTYINFYTPSTKKVLDKIEKMGSIKLDNNCIAQGIVPNPDVVNKRNIKKIPDDKIKKFSIDVNDGVFIVNEEFYDKTPLKERKYLHKIYEPVNLKRYGNIHSNSYIIYITKRNYENDAPFLISHLEKYRAIMDDRRENLNGKLDFFHLHWPREEDFFKENKKILSVRKCEKPLFHFTESEAYVMMAVNVIKTELIDLKYLTTFLNSKLIKFWLKYEGKLQGNIYQVDKEPLMNIPIHKPEAYSPFIELFDVIHFICSTNGSIVENIENSHLASFFEDVVDGCFFDIYFTEEMINNNLSIKDNVVKELQIAGLSKENESDKAVDMASCIQLLYNNMKIGFVQQRMRMYTVKSPNTLKPILEN